MEKRNTLTNPYRQGADDGFLFGLYLTCLFFASAFTLTVPLVGFIATVMLLAVPVIVYMRLRRTWVADGGMSLFSSLWMQGIMMFVCGALISGAVAFAYLRWGNPGWLDTQMSMMIDLYSQVEGGQTVADMLQKIVDAHLLPTPMQMTIQMIWFEIFAGSILCVIIIPIIRAFKIRTNTPA